jgi:transmembrane sensor
MAAFFDVMPDKTAPFQVVTNSVAITVLGTAFNVDATTDGVDVAVQHGRVQVAQRHNQKILAHLSAGQALIVPSAGAPQARQINPTDVALWRTGQFVVADAPLPRVLAQLQRYYVGWIMLPNKDLQQKRLTGIFNLHNPEAALEAIAKTYGAKVRKITPWVRVLEPNSAP